MSAANINYPIENNRDLITLLRQIDGKLLLELTKQKLYVPGLGRKVCGLIWAPIVECTKWSKWLFSFDLLFVISIVFFLYFIISTKLNRSPCGRSDYNFSAIRTNERRQV